MRSLSAMSGLKSWLLPLLCLGGCCIEESPALVTFSNKVEIDLEDTCRISNFEDVHLTAITALSTYLGALNSQPTSEWLCVAYYGTACQFDYHCDKPPDMSGPDPCPIKESPRGRSYACFGCGVQTPREPYGLQFNGTELDLLDRVARESKAGSRQEALHRAILFYKQIWEKKRKKPDFYQHRYNLPPDRKPDTPCR